MGLTGSLEVRGLTVGYPGFTLGPVDFVVAAGERVAVVGANGSGKSTLLRAMAGRLACFGGSVRVAGGDVGADRVSARTRVGVLPERLLGFGWMTVGEHLEVLAPFYPTWDPAYARALCDGLAVPVGKPLAHLSRGNRVKLSLAVAEAFRPPVLLLDEPTSGIDPVMRRHILELVGHVLPQGGSRSLVFSTHILEDVEAVADRVLLLHDGRLVGDVSVGTLAQESAVPAAIRRRLAHA